MANRVFAAAALVGGHWSLDGDTLWLEMLSPDDPDSPATRGSVVVAGWGPMWLDLLTNFGPARLVRCE